MLLVSGAPAHWVWTCMHLLTPPVERNRCAPCAYAYVCYAVLYRQFCDGCGCWPTCTQQCSGGWSLLSATPPALYLHGSPGREPCLCVHSACIPVPFPMSAPTDAPPPPPPTGASTPLGALVFFIHPHRRCGHRAG
jgi:hypothetical protein